MCRNWLGAAALALTAATATTGQTGRQVEPPSGKVVLHVAVDRERPERELVVLAFDTDAFLATKDGGKTWAPLGPGLTRNDLKHVYASPIGWWASLNKGGLMRYQETSAKWVRFGLFYDDSLLDASVQEKKDAAARHPLSASNAPQLLAAQVNDLTFTNNAWYAATSAGVLVSRDRGTSWMPAGKDDFAKQAAQSLDASPDGSHVWAIAQRNLLYSADAGAHWSAKELAFASAGNLRVRRMDDSSLVITSSSGPYVSKDAGREWNRAEVRDLKSQAVVAASANEALPAYEPDARSADGSLSGTAISGAHKPQQYP
jgi:photosystem II stability/assembly factor-like uncharacterized protein